MRSFVTLALVLGVAGNMYDLLLSDFLPPHTSKCPSGCAPWANVSTDAFEQARIDNTWLEGKVPDGAGNHCAMPAGSAGAHEEDGSDRHEVVTDSFAGPWCYCAHPASGSKHEQYCVPPKSIPQQINLQYANSSVAVASFVTFDESFPSDPPVARFGLDATHLRLVKGVAHNYTTPGTDREQGSKGIARRYTLNFVPLSGLQERTRYFYQVKSGASDAQWSPVFSFRSAYSSGETRIALYGDAGHSKFNMMGNLKHDCDAGTIDALLHMGDHAYNLGMADNRRGDAYLNAFQPVLSQCLWVPVIGNHESSDGDHFKFYENITDGVSFGNTTVRSTATSVLGHVLTKATLFGPSTLGAKPSHTSRYYSVNIGLIHIAALDLDNLDDVQLKWLDQDLAAAAAPAQRNQVPWIIATSHFPLYHAALAMFGATSSAHEYREGNVSERYATAGHEFQRLPAHCAWDSSAQKPRECQTVKDFMDTIMVGKGLEALLMKHGVDIYAAGHVHDYNLNYPMFNHARCQEGFTDPRCPVHICEGNGGVPGVSGKYSLRKCTSSANPWCRTHDKEGGAYGRITAYNATHLKYDHVQNNGGAVTDSVTIVQAQHGPFTDTMIGTAFAASFV